MPIVPPVLITRTLASALGVVAASGESKLVELDMRLLRDRPKLVRFKDVWEGELKRSWSSEFNRVVDRALARDFISAEDKQDTERLHSASMVAVDAMVLVVSGVYLYFPLLLPYDLRMIV